MTRKDSEKDVDRPHYYSQFWLDIAAGRRVIGGPRPEDEAGEADLPEPTPLQPMRKNGRNSSTDSFKETRTVAAAAVVVDEEDEDDEEVIESSEEETQQEDLVDEDEIPNIILDEMSPKTPASANGEPAEEGEDEFFEDEEDEENEEGEEDEEWNGRGGRKKAKPVRPVKPVKKPKPRRSF